MKYIIILFFYSICAINIAQEMYVCAINGLNIREEPTITSKVVAYLPYSTKIKIGKAVSKPIPIQGITGIWVETSFNNKKGFIFNGFLLPFTPPTAEFKTFDSTYIYSTFQKIGKSITINEFDKELNIEHKIVKQKLKNGMYYSNCSDYSTVYGLELNNINIEQGWVLCRTILVEELKKASLNDRYKFNKERQMYCSFINPTDKNPYGGNICKDIENDKLKRIHCEWGFDGGVVNYKVEKLKNGNILIEYSGFAD